MAGSLLHLTHGGARASVPEKYTAVAIMKHGDRVGDTTVRIDLGWAVDALNDNGQLLFAGFTNSSATLFQYSGGTFIPIVVPGKPAPTSANGKWPNGDIFELVNMNRNGDTVFSWFSFDSGRWLGTFQWDAKAQKSTALALKGMPAVNALTFQQAGAPRPAINDAGEVVFPAEVGDASGKVLGVGTVFRGTDGKLQPVALPQQIGADGLAVDNGFFASINNSGRVALRARRYGQNRASGYVWEKGELTPIVLVGSSTPDGAKIVEVAGAWVNNKNRNVLVEAAVNHEDIGPHGLYLWSEGKLSAVAAPGQPMPGGGRFATMIYTGDSLGVSFPNDAGQHAFYCLINEDGQTKTAAYLMDADGSLVPIIKTGATTEVGQVTRVGDLIEQGFGYGIALNNKRQVALILQVAGAPSVLTLLTPAAP